LCTRRAKPRAIPHCCLFLYRHCGGENSGKSGGCQARLDDVMAHSPGKVKI
jgi:hypothetical protein